MIVDETATAAMNQEEKPPSASATVSFDVGGKVYKFARSTLDRFPDTIMARMVSKEWDPHNHVTKSNNPLFIDRDGDMFRHVLNYMRDGEVYLPMTESRDAFLKELDYYGFDEIQEEDIHLGTFAEAAKIMAAVNGNIRDELGDMDDSIAKLEEQTRGLELRKEALKLAQILFEGSGNKKPDTNGIIVVRNREAKTVRFASQLVSIDMFEVCADSYDEDAKKRREDSKENDTNKHRRFLNEYLNRYGLRFQSVTFEDKDDTYSSRYCDFQLELTNQIDGIKKRKATDDTDAWKRQKVTFEDS